MSFSTVRCRELWHICGICGQVSIDLRPEVFAPSFVIIFFFSFISLPKDGPRWRKSGGKNAKRKGKSARHNTSFGYSQEEAVQQQQQQQQLLDGWRCYSAALCSTRQVQVQCQDKGKKKKKNSAYLFLLYSHIHTAACIGRKKENPEAFSIASSFCSPRSSLLTPQSIYYWPLEADGCCNCINAVNLYPTSCTLYVCARAWVEEALS